MDSNKMFDKIISLVGEAYKVDSSEKTQVILESRAKELLAPFGVCKWVRHFFSPATVALREDINVNIEYPVLDEEADETGMRTRRFDTQNGAYLSFDFYPAKGVVWSEEDLKCLEFVWELFFIIYGRGHLYSMFERANLLDGLTGAPNRQYYFKHIIECIAEGVEGEYIAGLMNIKNFRRINDRFGANGGDSYLVALCSYFCDAIENGECFCRLGGDNFAFFVRDNRYSEFEKKIENISFTLNFGSEEMEFNPQFRVGLYHMKKGDSIHHMMTAMNDVYQLTRLPETADYIWYEPSMSVKGERLREIADIFPQALQDGEFVAYYQPKVLIETKTLCGAEALCRWIRNGKVVPPADFIPILERDGSITKLDFYMLERVCQDIAEWKKQGLVPGRISVNFSKHHLHSEKLGEKIIGILDKYGVEHEYIEIELTEMSGHDDYDEMKRFVSYMKSQDVSTSVDDFGTGYSSLNMLTSICADIIKLDKSFLDDILQKPLTHRNMVKNIINMINELCMDTLAEGVETVEQAKLLEDWECKIAQGYLYDKPLPVSEFTKRLENPQYDI